MAALRRQAMRIFWLPIAIIAMFIIHVWRGGSDEGWATILVLVCLGWYLLALVLPDWWIWLVLW